ncbi:MAG: ATP-dependent DNA helicase [Alphaproteobacteria bacterium]
MGIDTKSQDQAAILVTAQDQVLLWFDDQKHHIVTPQAFVNLLHKGKTPRLVFCHHLANITHLGLAKTKNSRGDSAVLYGSDVLELFAFVRPARFCLPTIAGVMQACGIDPVQTPQLTDQARGLKQAIAMLLEQFEQSLIPLDHKAKNRLYDLIKTMQAAGWAWAQDLLALFPDAFKNNNQPSDNKQQKHIFVGLDIWQDLAEWQEQPPLPAPDNQAISPEDASARLADLLNLSDPYLAGKHLEDRPGQTDYAQAITPAFQPKQHEDQANLVLAEAGTGVGKTLGYIAPASLWAERNGGAVWISTFTRNLQQQIYKECDRLFPNPAEKAKRVIVRKGRENYLCLLNYADEVSSLGLFKQDSIGMGLIARWIAHTVNGDMTGSDFPSWLGDIIDSQRLARLPDRRGECIYSLCPHYKQCFIEHAKRQAKEADIVIANHALAMTQFLNEDVDDQSVIRRFVFDEGHHLFDAADNAFALYFTGREIAEMRHWVKGPEGKGRKRGKGIMQRLEEFIITDPNEQEARAALEQLIQNASLLPLIDWRNTRPEYLRGINPVPTNANPVEALLWTIHGEVYKNKSGQMQGFALESPIHEASPDLKALILQSIDMLASIKNPAELLVKLLHKRLSTDMEGLDQHSRLRLAQIIRSMERRITDHIATWMDMLSDIIKPKDSQFVRWFGIERVNGMDYDCGIYQHWLDPSLPFSKSIITGAHGVVITSATLTQSPPALTDAALTDSGDNHLFNQWDFAQMITGSNHLSSPALQIKTLSPFDYPNQTKIILVRDIDNQEMDQIASAMQHLFMAAGGGGVGLFTAIGRLRAAHQRMINPLTQAGYNLYAQHVDPFSNHNLIDIFKSEENACLLGTDAVRDGIDVPGRSLRLLVFDKVPWPRPDLLHKARKAHFGAQLIQNAPQSKNASSIYDDKVVSQKLKQAFGRLVRRKDDKGVFVMLDKRFPSRLHGAFPEGVQIEKLGIRDAISLTCDFLGRDVL